MATIVSRQVGANTIKVRVEGETVSRLTLKLMAVLLEVDVRTVIVYKKV